jgi:hypothetical protein
MWRLALVVALGCGRLSVERGTPIDGDIVPDAAPDALPAFAPRAAQSTLLQLVRNMNPVTSATLTVVFPTPPTPGNTIVVSVALFAQTPVDIQVTDNLGTTYQAAIDMNTHDTSCAGGVGAVAVYYGAPLAATTTPVKVTVAPTEAVDLQFDVLAIEYEGLSSQPFDAFAGRQTESVGSPHPFDSGEVTVPAPRLLVSVGTTCAGNPMDVAWADNAGFEVHASQPITLNYVPAIFAEQVAMSPGTYRDDWTVTYEGAPYPAIGVLASFR